MNKRSVSVIIPVYNAENFLERAVKSVLNQKNVIEILLIEDGSQDDSYKTCINLERGNPLVKVLRHVMGVNKGGAASRNLGIFHSRGDWIQFLDADDELLEDKIGGQLNLISDSTPFIVGNAIDIFDNGRSNKRTFIKDAWGGLIGSKLGITSANLFNNRYLSQVKGFNEAYTSSDEYELMFKILQLNENVVFDERYLTKIHNTSGSLTRSPDKTIKIAADWIGLRENIKEYLITEHKFSVLYKYLFYGNLWSFKRNVCEQDIKFSNIYDFTFYFEKKIKIMAFSFLKKIRLIR